MSRKLIEGQLSLHNFLSPTVHCPQPVDNITEKFYTPENEPNPKKRTPPSLENKIQKRVNWKESPEKRELYRRKLSPQLENMTDKNSTLEDQNSVPVQEEDNDEPLPRKTIDCMKIAMQELINPLEEKISQLIGTKERQEQQEDEIIKLKINQNELYRKCMKTESKNMKLRKRLEILESKMLEANLIMHGL